MTSIAASPSLPVLTTVVSPGFADVECQFGTEERPTPQITASGGQDTPKRASSATGMGPEGNTGDCDCMSTTFLTV